MNLQALLNLQNKGRKFYWVGLILFSGLSSMGLNLTPLPTQAQTAKESLETFPESFQELPLNNSKKQLLVQNLPNNRLPRTLPPKPSPSPIPKVPPSQPPLEINPPSSSPSEPPETVPEQQKPETPKKSPKPCEINASSNQPLQERETTPNSDTIIVKKFTVEGSTVFSCEKLEEILQKYINKPLSFAELLRARTEINELYTKNKYITTGAYIPISEENLDREAAEITIKVVEGSVVDIKVEGVENTKRLRLSKEYVRSRLRLGTSTPLNEEKLLNALRLLQVNPLIKNISAELRAGTSPGTNILEVEVEEEATWSSQISTNNGRSPSVGSFRRGIGLTQSNLLGIGDGLSFNYTNTDGSDGFDIGYTLPLNPRNGTLSFNYGTTSNTIIEEPFNEFDFDSESRYYQLSLRQPIFQTPNQEFALSLTVSRNENETSIEGIPQPISSGADNQGRTKVSAIRFAQEWVKQNRQQILSARSEFSLGIDAFNSTINEDGPDSRFFSWRGQFQWLRLFGLNTDNPLATPSLVFSTDIQLANEPLLPTEQLGFGGFGSIRGYRQDSLLTDNGMISSIEFRYPVWSKSKTVLLLIPFVNVGTGWNSDSTQDLDVDTLVSVGLGLQLIQSPNFRARLDWGIPLVNIDSEKRTWQENGVHFSVEYNPF